MNLLSKFKIFDNLIRSLIEVSIIIAIIYCNIIGVLENKSIYIAVMIMLGIAIFPYLLEFVNAFIFKKEGEEKQKTFAPKISGVKGTLLRAIITLGCIPYKAYISGKAILKTIYRISISKKHLLEWTTSEEAEKQAKSDLPSYYNQMAFNVLSGIVSIGVGLLKTNIFAVLLGLFWVVTPVIMWYISKEEEKIKAIEKLNEEEKE